MAMPVCGKAEILERLQSVKGQLRGLGVVGLGLFGSFVRGENTNASDVDVLVEFAPDKHTFDNFMEVSFLLENVLGRKVELVTQEALSVHIGPYILQEVERVSLAA